MDGILQGQRGRAYNQDMLNAYTNSESNQCAMTKRETLMEDIVTRLTRIEDRLAGASTVIREKLYKIKNFPEVGKDNILQPNKSNGSVEDELNVLFSNIIGRVCELEQSAELFREIV